MSAFTSVKRVGPVIVITRVTDNVEEFQKKFKRHLAGVNQADRREPREP